MSVTVVQTGDGGDGCYLFVICYDDLSEKRRGQNETSVQKLPVKSDAENKIQLPTNDDAHRIGICETFKPRVITKPALGRQTLAFSSGY
jgi:hypothetical protein